MRNTLLQQCELFIRNREAIKQAFRWDSSYVLPVCAAYFSRAEVDVNFLREVDGWLKRETGVFSNFRGTARPMVVSMIAADPDPEARLYNSLRVYELLKKQFTGSSYLVMAAALLSGFSMDYTEAAWRTREIYELMKQDHRLLTGSEDVVFAALMAAAPLLPEESEGQAERCYQLLKKRFSQGDAAQTLSHVLAVFDGTPDEKCLKVWQLYVQLKDAGLKYGRSHELPVLGTLAMLNRDPDLLLADMADVDAYLSRQRGYGVFGCGRDSRRMHAAMILINEAPIPEDFSEVARATASVAGLCAAIAAAAAAAAAAAT